MTAYEKELLALAVEATAGKGGDIAFWGASGVACNGNDYSGVTLADALTALLRDLGVEVPERPSAEGLAHMAAAADANGWRYLREFAQRDPRGPMYVLALLEGGES